MPSFEGPAQMFLALVALYSPLASVSSYFPVLTRLRPAEQARLALGLFASVVVFTQVALWVGEPLLELLGITTAALTATGGIALMISAVPLMRGIQAQQPANDDAVERPSWRSFLLMPTAFPLSVGGTTFAILVSFRAGAQGLGDIAALSLAALAFAAVVAATLYVSGHLERRISTSARVLLERIAGIILVAIASTLLVRGGASLVIDALEAIRG